MQKLCLIFLFLGVVACNAPKRPEGVLTQPQLAALIVEVYIGEARLDQLPLTKDSAIRYFIPFEQKLLKTRGISDSTLKKTYAYYLDNPRELQQVYDSVIDTLVLRDQRTTSAAMPKK